MTGENDKYNYSKAAHLYPPFSYIPCSAKNYKIAPALTLLLPRIPVHSAWVGIIGGLELLYLYLSGVLICHQQLVMWERFERTPG